MDTPLYGHHFGRQTEKITFIFLSLLWTTHIIENLWEERRCPFKRTTTAALKLRLPQSVIKKKQQKNVHVNFMLGFVFLPYSQGEH